MTMRLPTMTPVTAPPDSQRGKAYPDISWLAVAAFCTARPGQWFRVDSDMANPRTAAAHVQKKYGLEAVVRGDVMYVRVEDAA